MSIAGSRGLLFGSVGSLKYQYQIIIKNIYIGILLLHLIILLRRFHNLFKVEGVRNKQKKKTKPFFFPVFNHNN